MAAKRGTKQKKYSGGQVPGMDFLKKLHPAVKAPLGTAVPLREFWGTAGKLALEERQLIVNQALVLIGENYAHLPLKRSIHAIDPVQALTLLKYDLENKTPSTMCSEIEFHNTMIRIFSSMRDLHTNYLLPNPFNRKFAFLPFNLEEYFEAGRRRYQISHLVSGFSHPTFKTGVEITGWSGVPIDRAVEISADRNAGSNAAARHARGLQYLALRPLILSLPPDEEWVDVDYIDSDGVDRAQRFYWMVSDSPPDFVSGVSNTAALGLDIEMEAATQAKRILFAPEAEAADRRRRNPSSKSAASKADIPTTLPKVFRARTIATSQGSIGHLRIFTFGVEDPEEFIAEAERLVGELPQTMLVVDVRGNGGGHIYASEGLLQLFTPRRITPEPTQFIASPLNRHLCHRHRNNPAGIDLGPWLPSLNEARLTNAVYTAGHPITPLDFANARGQHYRGRVLCITDAKCYSATDIFAAGFQDHGIGIVLGVDGNTGAGGANVWTHKLLTWLFENPPPAQSNSPYRTLPKGAGMRVSIRRTLRVHDQAGSPLEDLGVIPDRHWELTRNDLLNGNSDLLEYAAGLLSAVPLRVLDAVAGAPSSGIRPITVTTDNIGRVDVYLDGRPFGSHNVKAGSSSIEVPENTLRVRLDGYSGSTLVVSNQLDL